MCHTIRAVHAHWTGQFWLQMSSVITVPNLGAFYETSFKKGVETRSFFCPLGPTLACSLVVVFFQSHWSKFNRKSEVFLSPLLVFPQASSTWGWERLSFLEVPCSDSWCLKPMPALLPAPKTVTAPGLHLASFM